MVHSRTISHFNLNTDGHVVASISFNVGARHIVFFASGEIDPLRLVAVTCLEVSPSVGVRIPLSQLSKGEGI